MTARNAEHLGLWYGTTAEDAFNHYTELVIFAPDDDKATGDLHVRRRSRYWAEPPTAVLSWDGADEFHCELRHWAFTCRMAVRGKFHSQATILTVTFSGSVFSTENYTVDLRQSDPSCHKYQHAAESLSYSYRAPSVSRAEDYFPSADASSEGLSTSDLEATVNALLRLDSGKPGDARTDGFLVLKNGKLVVEEYFWGLDEGAYHEVASCTKSICAILFGIAHDRGLVDPEDVVADSFPEIDTEWRDGEPIRVKHLLSMSSGTVFEAESGEGGLVEPGLLVSGSVAKDVLAAKRTSPPGDVWNYDNSLPFLVASYMERKTGMSLEAFADAHLFTPLGITDLRWTYLGQLAIDGKPSVMLAGGLYLRLRDMGKLGQMMLDEGVHRGRRILSAEYVRLSVMQHTKENQWPYGFFWHLNAKDQRHLDNVDGFMALGHGEQVIAVLPEQSLVICLMSSTYANKFGYRAAMKVINDNWIKHIEV